MEVGVAKVSFKSDNPLEQVRIYRDFYRDDQKRAVSRAQPFYDQVLSLCDKYLKKFEGLPITTEAKLAKEVVLNRVDQIARNFLVAENQKIGSTFFSNITDTMSVQIERNSGKIKTLEQEALKLARARIELAGKQKKKPLEVTDEEARVFIEEKKVAQANASMKALIDEESKSAKKRKKRKPTQAGLETKTTTADPVNESGKSEIVAPTISPPVTSDFQNLTIKFKILPRVSKRWEHAAPEAIRNFSDLNKKGERVNKYKELKDDEALAMRRYHYLPGVEKILGNKNLKRLYSFETETGRGMFANLIHQNKETQGIIYFGFGTDGTLIHRKFEPFEKLQDKQKDPFRGLGRKKELEEGDWQPVSDCAFEMQKDRSIKVHFSKEDYSVTLLPVKSN